jgi:hypothetical protein
MKRGVSSSAPAVGLEEPMVVAEVIWRPKEDREARCGGR